MGNVKEVNPLKQGLKQGGRKVNAMSELVVKEVNPLKQGLKLDFNSWIFFLSLVKEVNPLKQGLKLCFTIFLSKLLLSLKK